MCSTREVEHVLRRPTHHHVFHFFACTHQNQNRHKTRSPQGTRVSEKCSAVGTGYPRARRALHVEQRCSTLAPVGRLGRRKLAASLARRATIFDRISKDFAPPKPQNFLRAAPYGRGRPTAGALRARRPTARYPRSDPTSETRQTTPLRPLGPLSTESPTAAFASGETCACNTPLSCQWQAGVQPQPVHGRERDRRVAGGQAEAITAP